MTCHCVSLPARQDASLSKLFPYLFVVYCVKTTDVVCICVFSVLQEKKQQVILT